MTKRPPRKSTLSPLKPQAPYNEGCLNSDSLTYDSKRPKSALVIVFEHLCRSHVDDVQVALPIDSCVLRLKVSVDYLVFVEILHA